VKWIVPMPGGTTKVRCSIPVWPGWSPSLEQTPNNKPGPRPVAVVT